MPEKNIKSGCYLKVTLVDRGLRMYVVFDRSDVLFKHKQSSYRPGVAQRVSGS